MNNDKVIIDGIEVDVEKANNILMQIVTMEKVNLSTKKLDSTTMIKDIKKKIAEGVKCL